MKTRVGIGRGGAERRKWWLWRRGVARGQAGMEPADGPGALDFHGDEEIIEVVELGPPGPGETGVPPPPGAPGRPAPRPGPRGQASRCVPTPGPSRRPGTLAPPRWGLLRPRGRHPFALGRPWARGG